MRTFIILLLLALAAPAPAADLLEAEKALTRAVTEQARAQAAMDKWAAERAALMAEIRAKRDRLRRLEAASDRRRDYLDAQEAELEALRVRANGGQDLERDMEPALDAVLERLRAFVAADLAFLPEERYARLDALARTLGDYALPLSERLRRFLEALQVEAAYGSRVEAEDTVITVDGTDVSGRVLRLGRAAAFFLSRDGVTAARLLPGDAAWRTLPDGQADELRRALREALEMLDHRRVFELVTLPLEPLPVEAAQ